LKAERGEITPEGLELLTANLPLIERAIAFNLKLTVSASTSVT